MAKKPSSESMAKSVGVTTEQVTDELFPSGVPKNADGSIAQDVEISTDDAREAGAVSSDSARANRRVARTIHQKNAGDKHVRFNDTDALAVYEYVKASFGVGAIAIWVKRTQEPFSEYPALLMSGTRSSADLYNYVQKWHVKSGGFATTYSVVFREGHLERGRGTLNMPDMREDNAPEPAASSPQPPPFPWAPPGYPPQGGYPPPPYGPPPGYPPPGYPPGYPPPQGYGAPPGYAPQGFGYAPPQGYPPPYASPPAPPPPSYEAPRMADVPRTREVPPLTTPQVAPPPQAPPPPHAPNASPAGYPAGYDPAYAAYALASEHAKVEAKMNAVMMQNQMLLGELQAMRNAEVTRAHTPQAQPAPQPQQYAYPPPGYPPGTYAPPQPPAPPVAAAPPPPPPPIAPPPTGTAVLEKAVAEFGGMAKTLQSLSSIMQGMAGGQPIGLANPLPEEPEPELPPEDNSPLSTTMVGAGERAFPIFTQRSDGKLAVGATMMGAVPVVASMLRDAFQEINKMQVEQRRSLEAFDARRRGAIDMPQMQSYTPPQPAAPPPQQAAPPPPPPMPSAGPSSADLPWTVR